MKALTIHLDDNSYETLDNLAKKLKIPKSTIIRLAIDYFTNQNKSDQLTVEVFKELLDTHSDILTMNLMILEGLIAVLAAVKPEGTPSLLPILNDLKVIQEKVREYHKASKILHKILKKVGTDGN